MLVPPQMFGWRGEEVDDCAHLGFGGRVGAGAELLELLPPVRREVAVEIESLRIAGHAGDADRGAVVVLDASFGQQAVVLAARRIERVAPHQQSRLLRMLLPRSVRIGDAHLQDAAVAGEVLGNQSLDGLFVERIAARRRAHVLRPVGHRPLGAVRIDARADVERACIERAADLRVGVLALHQPVGEVQTRARCRQFDRVDIAVDPVGGFVDRLAGRRVRDRQQRDRTTLVAGTDRFQRDVLRVLRDKSAQQHHQVVVAVEA